MLLAPDQSWYWFYDEGNQRLALALGPELIFMSAFQGKQINPDCRYQQPFTSQHAKFYSDCVDSLAQQLECSDGVRIQTALNMVIARFFSIPMMPKSWYFDTSDTIVYARAGKTVSLQTQVERSQFAVIDSNEQSSLLMLLDQHCALTEHKSLQQFGLIKVMNDRIMPARQNRTMQIAAA
ncbi:cell division protein ZapC domain-containing protein [Ferrimonas lipolytica]|uniref:Cell division protein ZapC n=1 Tax=Ferrimonas lipolytica TaxID=2724191 RepID=A0A6H1UBV0_9GAMM|nr:cell division protein ZapC domain-containing protein [Ferrimonas lipolytica]QIZ76567.1 cell division protein ZapC [Ferrimonas lipolytica]